MPIKESEALDEFTHKGIHGNHTFCFEFAEWHMNRPLIRTGRAKAVGGQIGTLTDAHAGVANQQKGIATQIVAAESVDLARNDVLNLRVSAWNGDFGGVAEIYEEVGDLHVAASNLRGFPNNPSDRREIIFGNFDRKCAAGGVSMRFHCVDGAGHAYVEASVDSNYQRGGVVLAMPVGAAAVDTFVRELERLESERSGAALLRGKIVS